MPCYHPITGYRARSGRSPSGGWPIVFNVKEGLVDLPVTLPCGRCIGCRLEKSRQWAVRCVYEAEQYEQNSFVTLTYNNQHLSEKVSLEKDHIKKFLKRLRKQVFKNYNKQIRYFLCGEYGEQFNRPHYHLCIFNHSFPDKTLISTVKGNKLYRSQELEKVWTYGHSSIGELTFESAAYVARYVTKKITGENQEAHYGDRTPEFCFMSRKPGIGRKWFDKFKTDVLNTDRIIVRNNLQCRPPRYYDNIMQKEDLPRYNQIKAKRRAEQCSIESDPLRLTVKENVRKLSSKKLKRSLENGETVFI